MSVSDSAAITGQEATIWDLHQEGRKVRSLMGEGGDCNSCSYVRCVWSPDGSWIAAGPQGDGSTHVWETTTFQRLHTHTTWTGKLLAVSSDGRWVLTAAEWSIYGGDSLEYWIWNVESGKLHRSFVGHACDRGMIRAAAFDLGGTHVVTGSDDSTIRICDVESGARLLVLRDRMERGIKSVAFSGDGRMVLSHSRDHPPRSGETTVWDASTGAVLASFKLEFPVYNDIGIRYSACFSPCGVYVASGSCDKGALLWRISDQSCIAKVSGGGAEVTHVAFSPDGRVLCCGTEDGMVFFHRMHDLVSSSED